MTRKIGCKSKYSFSACFSEKLKDLETYTYQNKFLTTSFAEFSVSKPVIVKHFTVIIRHSFYTCKKLHIQYVNQGFSGNACSNTVSLITVQR